jgi:hypothetical protein
VHVLEKKNDSFICIFCHLFAIQRVDDQQETNVLTARKV